IRCHQFTLEVIVTAVVMGLVYCVNNLGCQAKALDSHCIVFILMILPCF
ncbi:hypothetical protein QZH41_015114, partial [Actinostola sp. cb2023]